VKAINPATGQLIRGYPEHDATEIERRVAAAARAFPPWRALDLDARGAHLRATAQVLRRRVAELSALMTSEMGKPIAAAEAEVEKCAWACEHFAEHAKRYLAGEQIATDASASYTRCDPLGVVLAIMPWNFPFWQLIRCAAPALMAGNTVLLKHASNVPGSALAIEDVFRDAGLPEGAFATLLVGGAAIEPVVSDPRVAAVSLTGSEAAGSRVASLAGAALKKTVLELGGSDAFIVLADADVDAVARAAADARTINNGESCIAAKRFIVEEAIADRFESAFTGAMTLLTVGDPMERTTRIGPLARADSVRDLQDQVDRSVRSGAVVAIGGQPLERPGFYYPPTVLTRVVPGMAVFDEETFGPVAAVSRARDVAHAIALANASRFGLGASVWTSDPARGERLAAEIDAGSVFVNGAVKSDPRLPFGGVKRSGYGRELAAAGIREFVNVKTVWRA
jgi:succinate-semialdehyde dehydrogenase/glutarate-semialdehyde dehydrogenase